MIPASFRSLRALRILNVAAVGLALSSLVGSVFTVLSHESGRMAFITALPTLLVGLVWAAVLRSPRTVDRTSFRWGWVASVPLAVLNSALAAGLMFSTEGNRFRGLGRALMGAIAGATLGAIIWIPALVGTLICFGVPIAWAQKLAQKGLAGEERGEWVVGMVCLVMSLFAIFVAGTAMAAPRAYMEAAQALIVVLSAGGMVTGGGAALLAGARETRRRRFVAAAEAGKVAGYRVDATDEGKVLVRVVAQGKGYRVADFEEEVFELDAEGEATRPRTMTVDG